MSTSSCSVRSAFARCCSCPLTARGRTFGVLTLVMAESMRRFDDADREFAEQVAGRAAVAVDNARLATSRRQTADTLQRSLLPDTVPPIDGWTVATFYRAARVAEEIEVGGDFYDFYDNGDAWIVLLGDVTGKGVEAAALTSLVRHGARFLSKYERSPSRILVRLNEALSEQPGLWLCTAVCVRLHREEAVIASAGHPPALIVRDDGRVREIGTEGPILGAWTGELPVDRTVPVGADETLFLYTDGVIDTLGEHDRFGAGRLKRLLAEHGARAAGAIAVRARGGTRPLPGRTTGRRHRGAGAATGAGGERRGGPSGASRTLSSYSSGVLTEGGDVASLPKFRIETLQSGSGTTIKLAGELDSATCSELLERFEQAAAAPDFRELVIDLEEVSFIDSSGMRAIIALERRAKEDGLALALMPPPPAVTELLRVTGITDRLPLAPARGRRAGGRPVRRTGRDRARAGFRHARPGPRRAPRGRRRPSVGRRQRHRDAVDLRAGDQRRRPSRRGCGRLGRTADHDLRRPRPSRGLRRRVGLRAREREAASLRRRADTACSSSPGWPVAGASPARSSTASRGSASGSSSTQTQRLPTTLSRISSRRRVDPSSTAPGTPWRARYISPRTARAARCRTPDPRPRRPRTPPRRGSRPRS